MTSSIIHRTVAKKGCDMGGSSFLGQNSSGTLKNCILWERLLEVISEPSGSMRELRQELISLRRLPSCAPRFKMICMNCLLTRVASVASRQHICNVNFALNHFYSP